MIYDIQIFSLYRVYIHSCYRFHLQCAPGQLLSYSVIEFQLEEQTTCTGRSVCVDWVDHHTHGSHKLCGRREPNTVYADGSNEMHIEFVSNRRSQSVGFQYFVTCINPRFDINSDDDDIECTSPPSNKTYNIDAAPLVTTSEVIIS